MAVESWDDAADVGITPGTLKDGVYKLKIVKWAGKPYEKGDQKGRIVKLKYEIVAVPDAEDEAKVGEQFEEDRFVTRPTSKRIFFDELKAVGFDVAGWEDGQGGEFPKGTMMPLALKYAKLRGLVLHVKKFTSNNYPNLRFVGRDTDTGAPTTIPNGEVLAVKDELEELEEAF